MMDENAELVGNTTQIFGIILAVLSGLIILKLIIMALTLMLNNANANSIPRYSSSRGSRSTSNSTANRTAWDNLVARANTLKTRHYEIETDWDVLFSYPALIDVTVTETAEMVEAMHRLNGISHNRPRNLDQMPNVSGTSLSKAVHRAEKAMDTAWETARYKSTEYLPDDERKKIDQLMTMLKLARTSDSAAERVGAYKAMRRELRRLEKLRFPEPLFDQIESGIRGELTA